MSYRKVFGNTTAERVNQAKRCMESLFQLWDEVGNTKIAPPEQRPQMLAHAMFWAARAQAMEYLEFSFTTPTGMRVVCGVLHMIRPETLH